MKIVKMLALVMIAACATSTEDACTAPAPSIPPQPDAGAPPVDAGRDAAEAGADAGALDLDLCSEEGWCQTVIGTSSDSLTGVWGDGAGVVWAVGSGPSGASQDPTGKVYRWDGKAWALHATFKDTELTGIWGSGPTDLYISATRNLKVYDNNGELVSAGQILRGNGAASSSIAWTTNPVTRTGAGAAKLGKLWGKSASEVWVSGTETTGSNPRGFVSRLTQGAGGTVVSANEYLAPVGAGATPSRTLTELWGAAPDDVWAAGRDLTNGVSTAVLLHRNVTAAGVVSWVRDASLGDAMSNVLAGIALGPGKSAVTGQRAEGAGPCTTVQLSGPPTWTKLAVPDCGESYAIYGSPTALWASSAGLVRAWNGSTWRVSRTAPAKHPLELRTVVRATWGTGPDDFWAVGDASIAMHKQKGKSAP